MSYLFKTTQNQIQIPFCWGFESNNVASSLAPAPAQNQLGNEPRTEADGTQGPCVFITDEKAVEDHGPRPLRGPAWDSATPVPSPLSEAAPLQPRAAFSGRPPLPPSLPVPGGSRPIYIPAIRSIFKIVFFLIGSYLVLKPKRFPSVMGGVGFCIR